MMQYQYFILRKVRTLGVCLLCFLAVACQQREKTTSLVELEEFYKKELELCIAELDSMAQSNVELKEHYFKGRTHFKRIEPILSFVDKPNYKALNRTNLMIVDEEDATAVKIHKPFGFQVLEELIFSEKTPYDEIQKIAVQSGDRLKLVLANTKLRLKDYHVLWLIRDEIVRLATVSLTGFDSPVLEQSLKETVAVYDGILKILECYEGRFSNEKLYQQWEDEIAASKVILAGDFDKFDRYSFIKAHAHSQLKMIVDSREDWKVDFPYQLAFQNNMTSLFTDSTFNIDFFSDRDGKADLLLERVALGKRLFNDNRLSKDNRMSCATCHHADKAFTDGLAAFPKQTRSTPTLRYAGLQQSFFHDGRAGSLEGQIVGVVTNPNEFHTDLKQVASVVANDSSYTKAFGGTYNGEVTSLTIRNAIATYIRTLSTFNSKFDENINGNETTITEREIHGFNLFMGKAKCATCHFPPLFNGTVPPYFDESELEAIGVPKDTLQNSEIDPDLGRYHLFKTEERKHFFKTPTVRNASLTAPYMHNGVYANLEQVMDFYNKGGGTGLGFDFKMQTLPSDSLELSQEEIEDIILFMKTLTDR